MASYIYEINAIQPDALEAIFDRITTGGPFTTRDLRHAYSWAHPPVETKDVQPDGSVQVMRTRVSPSHGDLARIIRALRETNVIVPVPGPSGHVTWGLDVRRAGYLWIEREPLSIRLDRARAILSENTSAVIPTPSQGANPSARELAAKQYDTIGPPDNGCRTFPVYCPYPPAAAGFRGFRGHNEATDSVPSALDALPPFKRVIETLKVIVGETVAKVVFDLRGVQDRDLEDIREASPDDKLRWANRHTPGIVIPTPNQQWSHRPNVPSIVLPIPV